MCRPGVFLLSVVFVLCVQDSGGTRPTVVPAPKSTKVVVHRSQATWSGARDMCRQQNSSLLCYSDATLINRLAAELTFLGFPRMWIRNRDCSLTTSEPGLSVELTQLDLSRSKTSQQVQHIFNTELDREKLPFICYPLALPASAPYSLNHGSATNQDPETNKDGEEILLEHFPSEYRAGTYLLVNNATLPWEEAKDICHSWGGSLACLADQNRTLSEILHLKDKQNRIRVWYHSRNCTELTPGSLLEIQNVNTPYTRWFTRIENNSTWTLQSLCTIIGDTETTPTDLITEEQSSMIPLTTPSDPTTVQPLCCPATDIRGIQWDIHCQNSFASRPCPAISSKGTARWSCNTETGEWMTKSPDLSNCTSTAIVDRISTINSSDVAEALSKLKDLTPTYGGDLLLIGDVLTNVVDNFGNYLGFQPELEVREEQAENLTTQVATVVDDLLGTPDVWNDLTEETRVEMATSLLSDQENAAFQFSYALNSNTFKTITQNHFAMQVMKDEKGRYDKTDLNLPRSLEVNSKDDPSQFTLPAGFENFAKDQGGNFTYVVYFKYNDLSDILVVNKNGNNGNGWVSVNSPVLSVSVNNPDDPFRLSDRARFLVSHLQAGGRNPVCAFWNTTRLDWDTDGCSSVGHNDSFTECACDHLTNFAVLMDIQGVVDTLSEADLKTLRVITQVGCILSIVFLSAAIVVATVYRALWGMRNSVHRNLCICLLVAEVLFIAGTDRTELKVLCSVIAGLLHYFFLAAFCWMFLEAVVIYLLLYKVFSPKKSYTKRFYAFGYGLPMLVVAISAAAKPSGYGTDKICWLSGEGGFLYSFVGPAALVLSVNFAALIYALRVAVRTNKKINSKAGPPVSRTWILGALTLVPLLGVTWAFGFLLVRNQAVTVYIFCVLNSLQGVAIFVVQCLLNQSSRKCLMKSFGKYTQLIPAGSLSSTLRSTVQTDVRQSRSTTRGRCRVATGDSTPGPPAAQTRAPAQSQSPAPKSSAGSATSRDPEGKRRSWNIGRLLFRTLSSRSRTFDLSSANYTDRSEVSYSTSDTEGHGIVLKVAHQGESSL